MQTNYDQAELDQFATHAHHWWDPSGPLKTLHHINPTRLAYIKEKVPLAGKQVLDIGCGGGLLTEAMAAEGAMVTGIDLNKKLIEVAKLHLFESHYEIHYQVKSAEEIAAEQPQQFDVVTCLELLEHVPDPKSIIKAASQLVKPNGHVFFSTINRHPKAYLFAILGAEYLLKLLPKHTHDYAKFIRPSELVAWMQAYGLVEQEIRGLHYHPFTHHVTLNDDVHVNYLLHARKS